MRKVSLTLGDTEIELAANFAASVEIAQKVGDPLTIAREATLENVFMSQGIPYEPKWKFNITNIPQTLHIGLKAAGSKMTLEEVQELVFEAGFFESQAVAVEYLTAIVGPKAEEMVEDTNEASGKK